MEKVGKFEPRTELDNRQVLDIDRILRMGNLPAAAFFQMINELDPKQFALGEHIALSDKFTFEEVYQAYFKSKDSLNPELARIIGLGIIRRKDCLIDMAKKIGRDLLKDTIKKKD